MIRGKGTQPHTALTQNTPCLHDLKVMILWPRVMGMYMNVFSDNEETILTQRGCFLE